MTTLAIYFPKQLTYPIERWPTTRRLDHAEQREALCAAIIEQGGVRQACEATGMHRPTVYQRRRTDREFFVLFETAKECLSDMLYDECIEIADESEKDEWSIARLRIETRMRIAGKLRPDTQVNVINDNRTVVVTEEKRQELQQRLKQLQEQT